jgi:hypothetical protein
MPQQVSRIEKRTCDKIDDEETKGSVYQIEPALGWLTRGQPLKSKLRVFQRLYYKISYLDSTIVFSARLTTR